MVNTIRARSDASPNSFMSYLFEQMLGKLVEGFAPYLPLMIARVGVEFNLYATIAHLLDDVARIFYAGVLLTTADEEYIQLLVERLGIRQHTWYLGLQIKV